MELSKAENRSAFAQAIKRRDGAMREMFGMGSDPVGHAEDEPQAGIWRIAGNRDRSGPGGLIQQQPAFNVGRTVP